MSNEKYGIEQWQRLSTHGPSPAPERAPAIKSFYESLWPVAEAYASPLNPTFLVDLYALAKDKPTASWLIRDGLVPLIWFFTNNPSPESFKGQLRIHSDFEEFVPEAWRPQCELYEFLEEPDQGFDIEAVSPAKAPKELILLGLVMPSVCSLHRLETDLEAIVTFFGGRSKMKSIRTRAFLPVRFEQQSNEIGASYYNRYMALVHRYIGDEIEYMEFEGLRWMYPEKGTYVHEFNEKFVFSDSYLSLLALSKRSLFVPIEKRKGRPQVRYDKIYPVYPHVGCGLRSKFKKPFIDYLKGSWVPETQDRAKVFYRSMGSYSNRAYPWPEWFASWCKEIS